MPRLLRVLAVCAALAASGRSAVAATLGVDSSAFWNGGAIPPIDGAARDGCTGRNISPPLRVTGIPQGARSLAVLVIDTDANGGAGFVHWLAYGIGLRTTFPPGFGTQTGAAVAGVNDAGTAGYYGPCPPRGDTPHHYAFTVYALALPPDRLKAGLTRVAFARAIAGRTLASGTLVGTFER
jgi:Raf kinase inhibitor-like YbhB/YbcL family protein